MNEYEVAYRWQSTRKTEIEALKVRLEHEQEMRVHEEEQHEEKMREEKDKLEKEKEKRVKVRQEKASLDKMYKNTYRQLCELQTQWVEVHRKHEEQVVIWEKERVIADDRREELKERVKGLQSDISRADHLHKEALEEKRKEITALEDKIR